MKQTEQTSPTEPLPKPILAVEITVFGAEHGGHWLVPDRRDNFVVRNKHEIHMCHPLQQGRSRTLQLTLSKAFDDTIRGLSFGRNVLEARNNLMMCDTGGDYYPCSPFKVSPGPHGSTQITVVNDPNQGYYDDKVWFFYIWPGRADGPRIDPQIYNKTPDGGTGSDDGGSPGDRPPCKA